MCFSDSPDPPPPPAAPPPPPPTLDQAAPDTNKKDSSEVIGNAEGVKKYRTTGLGISSGSSSTGTTTGLGISA
jgi:hypothetical protein